MVAHTIPRTPSSRGVSANTLPVLPEGEMVEELGIDIPTVLLNEMSTDRVRCYHCNRKSHFERECLDLLGERPQRSYSALGQGPGFGPLPPSSGRGRGSVGGWGAVLRYASQQPNRFRQPKAQPSLL